MAGTRPRTNRQSRVDWWRGQFQRHEKTNLSVTELCRQLGVSVATFYYWKKRVHEATPNDLGQSPGMRPSRYVTPSTDSTSPNFVPVSILEPGAAPSWKSSWQRLRGPAQGRDRPPFASGCDHGGRTTRRLPPKGPVMFPQLPAAVRVFLCTQATDMRKSFDGLLGMVASFWGKTRSRGICSCSSTAAAIG